MSGIKQIFRKEMTRIFKDKKMVFSVFLLPVLIMVFIMSIVGTLVSKMENDIEQHSSIVYMQNEPESFGMFLKQTEFGGTVKAIETEASMEEAKDKILNGKADLIIEFPEEFDRVISAYETGDEIPQIKTYYNPSEEYSQAAFREISTGILEGYRQTLLSQRFGDLEQISIFTVNSDNDEMIIQDEKKASGKAVGMMLPYFITVLLFAGAMGIGTDMIAGEKERGTMASLLVSPVKRSSIVLGKVFSLMAISGISSLVYVIVMVIFMPVMMKTMTGAGAGELSLSLSPQQIIMMGLLLVAIAFLYSSIIALISVFAKTTKEATSYVMPIYMLVLVMGLMTMFQSGGPADTAYYIPLYNIGIVLQGILGQEVTMLQFAVTVLETLALGGILTIIITRAFESEKVMAS